MNATGATSAASSATWKSHAGIPVRNLWVLLVYAAGLADFLDPFDANVEDDADLPDVLARLLAHVVERRLRRNLSSGYRPRAAVVNRVRGRIDWLDTETRLLLPQGRIACTFEELTQDTPRNRLVLAALVQVRSRVMDAEIGRKCAGLARTLLNAGVSPKRPTRAEMSRDTIARNDRDDVVMVRVAELALDLVLPAEAAGSARLHGLDRDEHLLRRIFEQAVAGFYRHEVDGRDGWAVKGQALFHWELNEPTAGLAAILPAMRADVVLQKGGERRIVLDTKFTGILTRRQYGGEGLKSGHLYQMYAYLRSQAGLGDGCADAAEGILLHPSVECLVDEAVTIQGHRLRFVTVDLAANADHIRNSLLKVVLGKTRS